jgi:hypothetical protein
MVDYIYAEEQSQYQLLKRVEFISKNFAKNIRTNIISDQDLYPSLRKVEAVLMGINEFYRNGNKIDEALFIKKISPPLKKIVNTLKEVICNHDKKIDRYDFNNNKYEKVYFKGTHRESKIDITKCFKEPSCIKDAETGKYIHDGSYDFWDYIYGHKKFIDNKLLKSLKSNKDAYQESANANASGFVWHLIRGIYYQAKMTTYVSKYKSMIDTITLLKTEIQSYYDDVNEMYQQIKKAYEIIISPNPNLITFTTRYLSFVDKCGKKGEPLVLTLTVTEFNDIKELLKTWYQTRAEDPAPAN